MNSRRGVHLFLFIFTKNNMDTRAEAFLRLLQIMDDLREKCPWDRKQTIQSLRILTIEETFELTDAIDANDWNGICEEVGDLLLHLVFYAKIASEKKEFTIEESINKLCEKLIQRHPHIYGDVKVNSEEDVKRNWEKLKLKEGKKGVLSGVPKGLPATVKAYRMQEKATQVGFDWEEKKQVWEKVEEELGELNEAIEANDKTAMEDELGDVFFSLVNYARFLGVDPEAALEKTNRKFKNRFEEMEKLASLRDKDLKKMNLAEMDELWIEAKQTFK
jgi:MazG family protein